MMLTRLCEKTLKAKKELEWNQTNELSLLIYCQSIVEEKISPSQPVKWDLLNSHREILGQIVSYEEYVMGKNDRSLEKKEVILL